MKKIPFSDVREFYERMQPGGHWFATGSMRFFKTRLPTHAYETNAGLLFVTSDATPEGVRAFTIRRQKVSGDIATIGNFMGHKTRAKAMTEIKHLHWAST